MFFILCSLGVVRWSIIIHCFIIDRYNIQGCSAYNNLEVLALISNTLLMGWFIFLTLFYLLDGQGS